MSVLFGHDEDEEGAPASEGVCPVTLTRAVLVLLPHVATLPVLLHHVAHQIAAQLPVDLRQRQKGDNNNNSNNLVSTTVNNLDKQQ